MGSKLAGMRSGVSLLLLLVTACGSTDKPGPSGNAGVSAGGSAGSFASGGQPGGGVRNSNAGSGGIAEVGSQQQSSKLDVLFVIDNSAHMADKQALLAASLPPFVNRLIARVGDIHFGAITTSLGNHGSEVCTPDASRPDAYVDDQGELIPSKRAGVSSYMGSGFLAFDKTGAAGVTDAAALTTDLQAMLNAAGETGCGYEAQLESMYRFLVDPEPPLSVEKVGNVSAPSGINADLLAQRAAFLRPDSAVAIVILSDETDCSILDSGLGWLVGHTEHMPRATVACDANPNDACCRSCAATETSAPAGCMALTADANCSNLANSTTTTYATWDVLHDSLNERCFEQKKRFGMDLLNPVERYSAALTNPQVTNRAGALVDNPLLAARNGSGPRSPSLISLSVIVGVPFQDLLTDESLDPTAQHAYMTPTDLAANGRWPMILGDDSKNVLPSDPLMIESIDARTGVNPLVSAAVLAPPTSTNPQANLINGHEYNIPYNDDLQYACIFPLPAPKVCAPSSVCDCAASASGDETELMTENSPLCQPPGGGLPQTTQYFGKGYPGVRELQVARALGARAVPTSICAWNVADTASDAYAYKPALSSFADRIEVTLK
jgi:hypothetical protein